MKQTLICQWSSKHPFDTKQKDESLHSYRFFYMKLDDHIINPFRQYFVCSDMKTMIQVI